MDNLFDIITRSYSTITSITLYDKFKTGKILDGITIFKLGVKLNKFIVDNDISKVIISTEKISVNRQNTLFDYFQNLNIQSLFLVQTS